MRCPDCSEPLASIELEPLELDYCVLGHGAWLDIDEACRVAPAFPAALAHLENRGASQRVCPRCEQALVLVTPLEHPLELDRCARGCGLWFDEGELQTLIGWLQSPEAQALDPALRLIAEGLNRDKR